MKLLLSFDPSTPLTIQAGILDAANFLDDVISNPITVPLTVSYVPLPSGTLAEAAPLNFVSGPGSELLAPAQAMAANIGPTTAPAGTAMFSSTVNWNPATGTAYDLIGVAEHELTHALGRLLSNGATTALSQFDYNAPGKIATDLSTQRYFSEDGGATSLAKFDTGSDPSDFAPGTPIDPFNAFTTINTLPAWTALDSKVMSAIGFDAASTVDITPASLSLTGLHFMEAAPAQPTLYVSAASGSPDYTTSVLMHPGDMAQLYGVTAADLADGRMNLHTDTLYTTNQSQPKVVLAGIDFNHTDITYGTQLGEPYALIHETG